MGKLRGAAKALLTDFGPVIVFYAANHFWGLRAALTAVFFGSTIFQKKSLIQEFAEKRMNGRPVMPAHIVYFKMWTAVWTAYFVLKAGAYAWIASKFSLERGLVIRAIVGNAIFYPLLGVSIFGGKILFPTLQRWRLLPEDPASPSLVCPDCAYPVRAPYFIKWVSGQ